MKGELAEKITGLVFNCTGIGLGLAGVSAATGGVATLGVGAIAGGLMLRNFMKNPDRLADARIKRIRRAALKSYDFNQSRSPSELEALDNCLQPFADALELAQITPQTLVSVIRENPDKDFPVCATDYVVARLGEANDIFKSGIAHKFVTHVMSECFTAAIEDRAYYEKLDPHVQIEQLKALGRLEAKVDIVVDELRKRNVTPKTERRAIRMLDTIETDDMSVDQIFAEILNRLEAAGKIDAQAAQRSNSGTDFDRLVQAVADALDADAGGQSAIQQVEDALAAHAAERDKMLDLGIQTAIAAGQAAKVAAFEIKRLGSPGDDWYDQVFRCKEKYHQEGRVHGVRLSLNISAEICGQAAAPAPTRNIWAALKNSEAVALSILGERGDNAALARSVLAFEAALEIYTRDAEPMDWAMTQNNLGNALRTVGERGDGAALARSVEAYEAVLEVYTRDAVPMDWAMTQNNLGSALQTLGARGDDASLARSVLAFEAALEVYTRDAEPMDWAMTQNNLGNALRTLGQRGDDAALARSVSAYEAALLVRTRAAAPMDWAMMQNNLGTALSTLGERGDDAALARSVVAYEAALEVRTRDVAPMQWAMTRENMGLLYLFRANRGERDYLAKAIKAFEDALSVYSEEHHPYDYGTASRALRRALALRDETPPTP